MADSSYTTLPSSGDSGLRAGCEGMLRRVVNSQQDVNKMSDGLTDIETYSH